MQNYNSISSENAVKGDPFAPIYPEGQSPEEIDQKLKKIDQEHRNMEIQLGKDRDQKLLQNISQNYIEINRSTSIISEIRGPVSTNQCFLEIKSLNSPQEIQPQTKPIEDEPSKSVSDAHLFKTQVKRKFLF